MDLIVLPKSVLRSVIRHLVEDIFAPGAEAADIEIDANPIAGLTCDQRRHQSLDGVKRPTAPSKKQGWFTRLNLALDTTGTLRDLRDANILIESRGQLENNLLDERPIDLHWRRFLPIFTLAFLAVIRFGPPRATFLAIFRFGPPRATFLAIFRFGPPRATFLARLGFVPPRAIFLDRRRRSTTAMAAVVSPRRPTVGLGRDPHLCIARTNTEKAAFSFSQNLDLGLIATQSQPSKTLRDCILKISRLGLDRPNLIISLIVHSFIPHFDGTSLIRIM
jgi:hypothetical protein